MALNQSKAVLLRVSLVVVALFIAGYIVGPPLYWHFVGLRPGFSMIEKVISLYWEMGEKEGAVLFVEEVLRRGIPYLEEDEEGHKGGPTGYLAWKMMVSKQFDV